MNVTCDLYVPANDLSLIYQEIYSLGTQTCGLTHEKADALACWYCATGGHAELVQADFN